MGATATLSESALRSEPGGARVGSEVRVRNSGTVVDQFTFEVVGVPAKWASVEPPALSLFPGAEGTVSVYFLVPRTSDVESGELPFGVRVVSREDPDGSVVEEGTLWVGAFAALFAELSPRTSRGRRKATHQLALDNRGNSPVNADLTAVDPDELLRFELSPPSLMAEPGSAVFSRVTIRPRKPFWRGPPQTHPFQVTVEPEDHPPVTADGTMLQEAVLPKWFFKAVGLAAAGVVALVALWMTVLKPTVETAAKDAVEEPLAQTNAALGQTNAAVRETGEALQELAKEVPGADIPTLPDPGAVPTTVAGGQGGGDTGATDGTDEGAGGTSGATGRPFDVRLAVDGTGTTDDRFTVGDNQVFSLTDVVFQNPAGDSGTLQLVRGDALLFDLNLANFRDLDYHFVSPIIVDKGTEVTLRVKCTNPPGKPCSAATYLTGFVRPAG